MSQPNPPAREDIDTVLRRFNYEFFKLHAVDRFSVMIRCGVISNEMITSLPLSFFKAGIAFAQSVGGLQRLIGATHKLYVETHGTDEEKQTLRNGG